MMEPRRLIEDSASDLELALLRVGREGGASGRARLQTLSALGVAGSAAVAGKSAAATLSAWSLKSMLAGGALVAAATVGLLTLEPSPSTPAPEVQSAPPLPVQIEETPSVVAPPSPEVEPIAAPIPAREDPPAAVPPAPRSAPSASIAEELGSLDAARTALAAGDAAGALARLDEHSRRFPRGSLALEAEVLRIEALAKSGSQAAAATRARAFVARYPSSVFTPRVRRIAGE